MPARRLRVTVVTLTAVATALMGAPAASAAPPPPYVSHENVRVLNAYAFGQVEPCLFVGAWLVATREAGTRRVMVSADVALVDTCDDDAGEVELSGAAAADVFAVQGLHHAHVVATLPLATIDGGTTMSLPVDLVFTGVGEVLRGHDGYREHVPGTTLAMHRATSAYRQGTVTGSPTWFTHGDLSHSVSNLLSFTLP